VLFRSEIEEPHRFADTPAATANHQVTANHATTTINHRAAALGAKLGKRMLARGAGELIGRE
jgi:hypothetical protein